ncbi:MAG: hypothetical protein HQM08_28215 [Candidatus Riflebacteria bacterium]|nr:hypothetical protein [Candidatus Riflebacteria bacterium]
MKNKSAKRILSASIAIIFFGQVVIAEVEPTSSGKAQVPEVALKIEPAQAPQKIEPGDGAVGQKTPGIALEVVPSDGHTVTGGPAVAREVVPSDGHTVTGGPAVAREVVPSDGHTVTGGPAVAREVVPSDGNTVAGNRAISKEVVPSDGNSKGPAKAPPISPFIGEVAVGVSMLVAYGPQILYLAATVAALASAVSLLVDTSKESAGLVKSIGAKLKQMLSLLIGPVSVSTGVAKGSVDGLSAQLLNVTKFVNNSVSTPVDQIQGQVNHSLEMSKEVENISKRGLNLSQQMSTLCGQTKGQLSQIVSGGQVQIFRDGASQVADTLNKQASQNSGCFNQTLENTKMTTASLNALKQNIEKSLASSGKNGNEVTLYDIGLSGAEVSKKLIDARKYQVRSSGILASADKSTENLDVKILQLLNGVKGDLENFAKAKGVDPVALNKMVQDTKKKIEPVGTPAVSASMESALHSDHLAQDISFMVDEMTKVQQKADKRLMTLDKSNSSSTSIQGNQKVPEEPKELDELYQKKISAYRSFVEVMTKDPGNSTALQNAQLAFEMADTAFKQASEQKH